MTRFTIARILSLVATVLAVAGAVMSLANPDNAGAAFMMVGGMFLGLVSYCFCGLLQAILTPFSLAGWAFLAFRFPSNFLNAVLFFMIGCFAVLLLPIYPVNRAARGR